MGLLDKSGGAPGPGDGAKPAPAAPVLMPKSPISDQLGIPPDPMMGLLNTGLLGLIPSAKRVLNGGETAALTPE